MVICMVALGALLSTAWVLDANSWMQTPAGYREVSGQFQPVNWFDAIFNPAFDSVIAAANPAASSTALDPPPAMTPRRC
jgi:cytochrome bd-type quinol oxidase subunit 1